LTAAPSSAAGAFAATVTAMTLSSDPIGTPRHSALRSAHPDRGRAGRSGLRMHCPGACAAARAQVVLPRAAAPTNRCACLASPSAPLTGPGSRPGPTATISA
jgi:hypothetical protein